MRRQPRLFALFFICLGWIWALSAQAAFDNYNSVLLGSRASGLGGAFAALSGDASASPFYNPATTVLTDGNAVATSVTLYSKYDTVLGKSEELLDATQRVNRGFFRSLPSASGTVSHFGSFALALSILVPDYDSYSGPVKSVAGTTSYVNLIDESLWVGGSLSVRLTHIDAVGLSVYYTARKFSRSISDKVVSASNTSIILEEKSLTNNSIVSILGYHRKLSDTWSVGVSYRAPSLPFSGESSYYRSTTTTSPAADTVISQSGLRAKTRVPAKFTLGVARELKNRSSISFDLNLYEGVSYNDMDFTGGTEQVVHRQVANFSFGYEQNFVDLIWRMGFFTNFSSHPVPDPGAGVRQSDGVEMGGFASNIEIETSENSWITLGGYYNGGRGKTLQYVGGQLALIEKTQQNYTLLVSSGFRF